jgi:hypothetical protein
LGLFRNFCPAARKNGQNLRQMAALYKDLPERQINNVTQMAVEKSLVDQKFVALH